VGKMDTQYLLQREVSSLEATRKHVSICQSGTVAENTISAARLMSDEEMKSEWQFYRAACWSQCLWQAGLISEKEYRLVMVENIKAFSLKLGEIMDF